MARQKKQMVLDESLTPAAKYGVYLGYLSLLGWVNLPFIIGLTIVGLLGWYGNTMSIILGIFSVCSVITILCLILSFFKSIIGKFQTLIYILISIEFFITMLWFDFIGLLLSLSERDGTTSFSDIGSSQIWFYLIPILIVFLVTMIFFYFYHKNKTVTKLNNYFYGGKAIRQVASFGTIFGFVMLGGSFFEGNVTFGKIIWVIVPILLTATLPAGIMGGIFSAVYIHRHPEYKELTLSLED